VDSFNQLPVFQEFAKIEKKWNECSHLILKSPTGSGKSLMLPYLLKKSNLVRGKIFVMQPRRIAARMLARQLATMIHCSVGEEVGYQVRFDKQYCHSTNIIYATDGIILQKLLRSDEFDDVDVLILDEFHERTVQGDLCLALALNIWKKRRNFRLVVTSATLNLVSLEQYLPDSGALELSGRSFPVEILHQSVSPQFPMWKSVVEAIPSLLNKMDGDILIFMDGAYEISKVVNAILSSQWSRGIEVRALYGELTPEKQDLALAKSERRKIIVSTNIAETSLTISGIKIVIDTGKAKKMRYDHTRGVNALLSEPISKSSADQRAGRAGRIAPGVALRLWSEKEHQSRIEFDVPEIQCVDLSEIYLNLSGADLKLERINLLEPIAEESLSGAKSKLRQLGAISDEDVLTDHGKEMSQLPVHPSWANALLIAKRQEVVPAVSLLLAMLDGRSIVQADKLIDFFPMRNPRSDIYCLLLAFEEGARRAFSIQDCKKIGLHAGRCQEAERLARTLSNMVGVPFQIDIPSYDKLAQSLLACFYHQVARLVSDGRSIYEDCAGRRLHLSRNSVLRNEKFILPLQVLEKKISGRMVLEMEWVSGIDECWLRQELGSKVVHSNEITFDLTSRKVVNRQTESWENLVLSVSEQEEERVDVKAKVFARSIMKGDLKLKNWNAKVDHFLQRRGFLASKFPELGILDMDDETRSLFFEELCQQGASWREIKNLEIYEALVRSYSEDENKLLDQAAPVFIDLKNGRRASVIDYSQKNEACLKAFIQDLYDIKAHPTIVFDRYPLILEIMAPNRRIVHRTSDITCFWQGAYPMVRKELAGRYPKHEWR
jgi:ATP-dependent helicase HrpB